MPKIFVKGSVLTLALLVFGTLGFAQYQSNSSSSQSPSSGSQSAQTSSSASNSNNAGLSSGDRSFVMEAARDGLGEVQIAQLAQQKASSDQVKDLAQKLVNDHQKANDELKSIASQENITLPTEPSQKDKARIDRLSKLSGQRFDQAFLKEQVRDHQKDIRAFRQEADNGQDAQLKQFAQKNLDVMQQHLSMVQKDENASGQNEQNPHTSKPATSTPPPQL